MSLRSHAHRTRVSTLSFPPVPPSSIPRSTSPAKTLVSLTTRRVRTRLMTSSQGSPPDGPLVRLRLSRGTRTNPGLAGDNPMEKTGAWTDEGGEEIGPPTELCLRVARRRGLKGE
jgi:hypothetical protein